MRIGSGSGGWYDVRCAAWGSLAAPKGDFSFLGGASRQIGSRALAQLGGRDHNSGIRATGYGEAGAASCQAIVES